MCGLGRADKDGGVFNRLVDWVKGSCVKGSRMAEGVSSKSRRARADG